MRRSSSMRAMTALTWRSSRSIGFWAAWITWLCLSVQCFKECQGQISPSFGVAELCPFHCDIGVALFRLVTDFATDVLSLAVAIGPDEKDLGIAGLRLDVVGDGLLVFVDNGFGGCLKQLTWGT